jgi:hypothetical protein
MVLKQVQAVLQYRCVPEGHSRIGHQRNFREEFVRPGDRHIDDLFEGIPEQTFVHDAPGRLHGFGKRTHEDIIARNSSW